MIRSCGWLPNEGYYKDRECYQKTGTHHVSCGKGNIEQGKCWLTNEYPFILFLIGHWYYEKKIVFIKMTYSSRYSFVACSSRYAWYSRCGHVTCS